MKRQMENAMMSRTREDEDAPDERKFPVMRTLARLHECDAQTILDSVDATKLDVHDILTDMVSRKEVEPSKRGSRGEKYTLTLKGWGEYMKVLGSLYELSE